jgi:hypothetical protein
MYPASDHSVMIPVFDLLPQVQLEAVLWGIGTALGELPPYFISRAGNCAMHFILKSTYMSLDALHIIIRTICRYYLVLSALFVNRLPLSTI